MTSIRNRLFHSLCGPDRSPSWARWAALALALCALPGLSPGAAPPLNPYEGTVAGEPSGEARTATLVEALRQVAVRATGRRAAATDPALASLYGNARQYVQTLTPAGPGQVTVGFDAPSIESALARAGQPLWNGERPVTLVLLVAAATGQLLEPAAAAAERRALDRAAQTRGVVLLYPTRAASEQLAGRLEDLKRGDAAALVELAHRYGADEVLVGTRGTGDVHYAAAGRVVLAALPASGEEALNALVDRYAADQALAPGTGLASLVVEVHGLGDVRAYAAARRALEGMNGVKSVTISEAERDAARFIVVLRGGAEGLRRALGGAHFVIDSAAGAEPVRVRLSP